jgi:hypothetical protein
MPTRNVWPSGLGSMRTTLPVVPLTTPRYSTKLRTRCPTKASAGGRLNLYLGIHAEGRDTTGVTAHGTPSL